MRAGARDWRDRILMLAGYWGALSDAVRAAVTDCWGHAMGGPSSTVRGENFMLVVHDAASKRGLAVREIDGMTAVCDGGPTGSFDECASADLLLDAYRRSGSDGLGRVGGAWSAAVLERSKGVCRLVLARGGAGACPLYLATVGTRLLFASTVALLLADPALPLRADERRIRDYLAGRPPIDPAATFFAGIRSVPAGHWLSIGSIVTDAAAHGSSPDLPMAAPVAFAEHLRPDLSDGARRWEPLPDAARFVVELPEAVRELGEPLVGLAHYLAWRSTRGDPAPAPAADGSGNPEAAIGGWLRVRRAQIQGIFRSPAFCSRPYWNGLAVAEAFRRACGSPRQSMMPFWRALNVELWLRTFIDRPRGSVGDPLGDGELEALGDRGCREGVRPAVACRPDKGRHLAMVAEDGLAHLRLPVRTRNVWPGDELDGVVEEGLRNCCLPLRAGDVLVVAEKIVAVAQGRVVPVEEVRVSPLARLLSRYTFRTPSGISLGMPESFELAIREVGVARILIGAVGAAITRPLGIRGVFYRIAGWQVAAIDSPDADALPPSNTCIKLAPRDPDGVALRLAEQLTRLAGARVEVAVVDVNDVGAEVLGASSGVNRRLLVSLLRDNPLGQDTQQTPVGIVRQAFFPFGDAVAGR